MSERARRKALNRARGTTKCGGCHKRRPNCTCSRNREEEPLAFPRSDSEGSKSNDEEKQKSAEPQRVPPTTDTGLAARPDSNTQADQPHGPTTAVRTATGTNVAVGQPGSSQQPRGATTGVQKLRRRKRMHANPLRSNPPDRESSATRSTDPSRPPSGEEFEHAEYALESGYTADKSDLTKEADG